MIYTPREDSFLLERFVKELVKGRNVLDVGCGSGIQIKAVLKGGAKSVAGIDVDERSLAFCKGKGLSVLKSDLFENVKRRFDLIVFNPPYLPDDKREDSTSKKATTGGKKGDEIIVRFLSEVGEHLEKEGIVLLVVSSLTPKEEIERVMKKEGFRKRILCCERFFMESLEVWELRRSN